MYTPKGLIAKDKTWLFVNPGQFTKFFDKIVNFLKFSNNFMVLLFDSNMFILGSPKNTKRFSKYYKKTAISLQCAKKFSHETDEIKMSKKNKYKPYQFNNESHNYSCYDC